ncbi:MAG TPA: glycosyltransferase family 39 protein [Tepidisphaeraceae bacterium]|nr:glycosyltransferase family 39 protein [Tepidisphaeraceae bacterium]
MMFERTTSSTQEMELPPGNVRAGRRRDLLLALLCASVTVGWLLATNPVAELPFNDDFSYSFTARELARTGHLQFNGWATAALGPQAYWGALLIRIFGFSFTLLRLGALPLAGAAAALGYALARRCGLRPGLAALSALTLALSPLCLPLAASFMTDVPGLLFALAALYAVVRAGQAQSRGSAIGWMVALVAISLVGGTVRQIVWVTALAGLPCVAWNWRKDRAAIVTAVAGWICVAVGAWATMRWVAAQPYATPEAPMSYAGRLAMHHPGLVARNALSLLFTLALLVLPAIVAALAVARNRLRMAQWVALAIVLGLILVVRHVFRIAPTAPWMGNIITRYGVMDFGGWGHGRPPVLPGRVWSALSMVTYVVIALGIIAAITWLTRSARQRGGGRVRLQLTGNAWVVATLIVFAAGYFVLLLPRCAYNQVYDRYVLPMFPAVTIPLLLLYQREASASSRGFLMGAWITMIALALFGLGITQEVQSLARARVAAANEVLATGVPRTQVMGDFEYDFWTQIETQGYVNDSRIKRPAGAYHPGLGMTPALHPKYRVVFAGAPLLPDEAPANFPTVSYLSFLPPFHRELTVRRVTRAPAAAAPAEDPRLFRDVGRWY